jgi:hypothetical protein
MVRGASLLSLVMVPALAFGQGGGMGTTPQGLDINKFPVGSRAD